MKKEDREFFNLGSSWEKILEEELEKPYIAELISFVKRERESKVSVYPPQDQVFQAFLDTPYTDVNVVIVGQDPYHGPGQANGLCFSVSKDVALPPSLKNIYKELSSDLNISPPLQGDLSHWAKQGVFLLNATLTVRQAQPLAHHGKGWELFTDAVIKKLCERLEPVIFVLWGKSAQDKFDSIHQTLNSKEYILTAAHPSPFSAYRGFLGCKHFSKINQLLKMQGKEQIRWG